MPTPAIFRDENRTELKVDISGYIEFQFFARIPNRTEINELRLQLATSLGIGNEYLNSPDFDESLGYALLDKYLQAPYPSLIITVFEELPPEKRSWKYFPDSVITNGIIEALIDKVREIEEGKKKSKPLDALRKQPEPIRLVSNPTPENISEVMDTPRSDRTPPNPSTTTDRSTGQPAESITQNPVRESKKIRHRVE